MDDERSVESEVILCITPNPAIDRTIILPDLVPGNIHRAQEIIVAAGGKGLNVARTIRKLGGEPLCMGFAGGHAGHLLADLTQNEGLPSAWTWTSAETRMSTILVSQGGDATVINEPGMPVSESDWERLQADVHVHIASSSLVCLSGSLPPLSSGQAFKQLLDLLVVDSRQVWADTSGTGLNNVLIHHPGIHIKVNADEIGDVLGFEVKDVPSARRALLYLGEHRRAASVITLGAMGALLAAREERWHAQGPSVHVVSTVGSGDAFLGGLARALEGGSDWPGALGDAVAAGTANALSAGGGQFTIQEFQAIRKQVQIRAW